MAKKVKNKIFLFPLALAVIFFASIIIIFSPVGKKNIIALPTPTSIPLQTYRSDKYGFEFQYPKNWTTTETDSGTFYIGEAGEKYSIEASEMYAIAIFYYKNPHKRSLNELYNSFKDKPSSEWITHETLNKIKLAGIDAYINKNNLQDEAFTVRGDYEVSIVSTHFGSEILDPRIDKVYNQILSTFKFLPDTSTWKTYQNTQYGFEFKYPSNLDIQHKKSENIKYLFSLSSPKIKYIKSLLDTDIVSMGTEYTLSIDNEKCDAWNDNFGIYGFGSFQKIFVDSNRANVSYDGPSQNTYAANIEINKGCLSIFGEYGTDTINNSRSEFDQILSTYKFLPTNLVSPTITAAKYTCPASEWVDCMPGPNQGVKLECTPEALNWFKLNCPNFKGADL